MNAAKQYLLHWARRLARCNLPIHLCMIVWVSWPASARGQTEPFYFTNIFDMLRAPSRTNVVKSIDVTLVKSSMDFLPHDLLTNIFDEVRGQAFRDLVCRPVTNQGTRDLVPDFCVAACEQGSYYTINFGVEAGATNAQIFDSFERRVRFYVASRARGHSSNYVAAALKEVGSASSAWPTNVPISIRDKYWVPHSWIKKHDSYWVVVDGRFAWSYREDASNTCIQEIRDAQEYDPKLRSYFEQAEAEVQRQRAGYGYFSVTVHDMLLESVLLDRFGIRWIPPSSLAHLN